MFMLCMETNVRSQCEIKLFTIILNLQSKLTRSTLLVPQNVAKIASDRPMVSGYILSSHIGRQIGESGKSVASTYCI